MPHQPPKNTNEIEALEAIMAALRDPEGGCPWDLAQDHRSIAHYCLEEAYEVVDAIESGDDRELKEELGDLLLQVVFHAQMASERDAFTLADVIRAICDKMVRRHPHVFAAADGRDAAAQADGWEAIKAQERADKGVTDTSILANIPVALPALTRAEKIGKRAVRAGFEWPEVGGVIAKIREELAEVEEALESGDRAHTEEEIGDFLFSAANLTRHLKIDGETALRAANAKFERRFRAMEAMAKEAGREMADHTLAELEAYWARAKSAEGGNV